MGRQYHSHSYEASLSLGSKLVMGWSSLNIWCCQIIAMYICCRKYKGETDKTPVLKVDTTCASICNRRNPIK